MTKQHRAMPELWAAAEKWGANTLDMANCLLELRARIEALEAAQQKVRSAPESPLVERVADAIAAQATSAGIVNDRPAGAAILEVAAWLREQGTPASGWAMRLEQEAGR
jgi:hypothetical protein